MSSQGYARITLNESNVSRRIVYLSCLSKASPFAPVTTNNGAQPVLHRGGAAALNTSASLVSRDNTNGLYSVTLTASECSVMGAAGPAILRFSNASTFETVVYLDFTAVDLGDSIRGGMTSLPASGTASVFTSSESVGLKAQTHSGATVGIAAIAPGTYSGVTVGSLATIPAGDYSSSITFGVGTIKVGSYSGVTVGAGNITPGTYSGVTLGVNNIAAGSYSGVTFAGVTRVNSSVTIADASYSAVTVQCGNTLAVLGTVTAAVVLDKTGYSVSTVLDKVGYGLTPSERSAGADALLGRSIDGGASGNRTVSSALYVLRNRVDATGSIGTVYSPDDSSSAWTFSSTTGGSPINSLDPS